MTNAITIYNTSHLDAGVYFVYLKVGSQNKEVKKMIVNP